MTQTVIQIRDSYQEILDYLAHHQLHRIFLVCDQAYRFLKISRWLEAMEAASELSLVRFDHFQPNPSYESVVEGVRAFHASGSQAIWAIGGGSAMDVAKCIKLYAHMDPQESYLKQRIVPNSIPLMAMPTTAGTGSEATRYAVIYDKGVKQSVSDLSCIPSLPFWIPAPCKHSRSIRRKAPCSMPFAMRWNPSGPFMRQRRVRHIPVRRSGKSGSTPHPTSKMRRRETQACCWLPMSLEKPSI